MDKPTVVYVAPKSSTFVLKDLCHLSLKYDLRHQVFISEGGFAHFGSLIRQLGFLIFVIPKSSAIFVMFGGYHSFLPALFGRIFRKKVYILLGGTDCVSYPSIGYGTFRKRLQGVITCLSYRLASTLLPVHQTLIFRREFYYATDSKYQGLNYWCRSKGTPFRVVPNGYDSVLWEASFNCKVARSFISVASISNEGTAILKGIDIILQLAPLFPDCTFSIVGYNLALGDRPLADNIFLYPFLHHNELATHLASTRFYLQLSISEGFPNALCEAMLSECVPIGSNVASIPEIIGDSGFVVGCRDIEVIRNTIEIALKHEGLPALGTRARERIELHFPYSRRASEFDHIIQSL